ncbi:hypothetical protein MTO96_029152 [Rhipicephalus appendiculatus]
MKTVQSEMEGVTLAEFMVEYNRSSLRKRQKPAVLRCRNYTIDDVVNYKREHVMLYVPFRKELDILDGNAFEKMFDDNKEAIMEIKQRMVAESCEYKHDSVAIHMVTGHRSRQEEREALARIEDLSRAESGNLPSVVTFCTKRPYMLLKNIDVTDGLVNGMVDGASRQKGSWSDHGGSWCTVALVFAALGGTIMFSGGFLFRSVVSQASRILRATPQTPFWHYDGHDADSSLGADDHVYKAYAS